MPDSAARSAFPWILKYYMERDDLTQVDIANRLKVSKQTVSDWVSGKKFPRVDRMQQLADLFGVLMSEMYTPTERPSQEIKAKVDELSADEKVLISGYRSLPRPGQEYMLTQLTAAKAIYGEKESSDRSADVG